MCVCVWEGWRVEGGGVCAKCGVTEEDSLELMLQCMMVRGRWVKKGNFSVT